MASFGDAFTMTIDSKAVIAHFKHSSRLLISCLLFALALLVASGVARADRIAPSDYPELTDKQIGLVRHIVRLANQIPGDWTDMGSYSQSQAENEAYRFQLAEATYALGVAQYLKTPAYRELYSDAMDRLIQKMLRRDVWGFWVEMSQSSLVSDPDLEGLYPPEYDPVGKKNIHYSGHLLMMATLYEMLYRDGKYEEPGSFTFVYPHGMGTLRYEYDLGKLARLIHAEFEQNHGLGSECEVNNIYVGCAQYPLLGLLHYDHINGTNLARPMMKEHAKAWSEVSNLYVMEKDPLGIPVSTRVRQQDFVQMGASAALGSMGMIHAWNKEYVEAVYPVMRDKSVSFLADGTPQQSYVAGSVVDRDGNPIQGQEGDPFQVSDPAEFGAPVFHSVVSTAVEVGDEKFAKAALDYLDREGGVWKNGEFYYPRNDDYMSPAYMPRWGALMLATAHLNEKDGLWRLYNKPWGKSELSSPQLTNVEYPRAIVKQAYYDAEKDTLVLTLVAGEQPGGVTTFAVERLDPSKTYTILRNGKALGRLQAGKLTVKDGGTAEWREGVLRVTTDLSSAQTYVISAKPTKVARHKFSVGS